jgi:hypothetical protein
MCITSQLLALGYTPLNFRFYKVFDRESKSVLDAKAAARKQMYELFYLYVDLVLDKGAKTKTVFFSDKPVDAFLSLLDLVHWRG